MDELEGARRARIQITRQGVNLIREDIEANRKLATAYHTSLRADVGLIPLDLLQEYEEAVREQAASCLAVADVLRAEREQREAGG